jgi:hypothetical protein
MPGLTGDFRSFAEFKKALDQWIKDNPKAFQLDGSPIQVQNPTVICTFILSEVEQLKKLKVSLHGDAKVSALKNILEKNLSDFIIVPPNGDNDYWRFHFKETHGYSRDDRADGLYAYIK